MCSMETMGVLPMDVLRHLKSECPDFYPDLMELNEPIFDQLPLIDTIDMETDLDDIMDWKYKHPESWTSTDVISWIYATAFTTDLNMETLHGERFQNLNGSLLCSFTVEDFLERDRQHGAQLHGCLQKLLQEYRFYSSADLSDIEGDLGSPYSYSTPFDLDLENWGPLATAQQIPSIDIFLSRKEPFVPVENVYSSADEPSDRFDPGYESAGSSSDNSIQSSLSSNAPSYSPPSSAAKHQHQQQHPWNNIAHSNPSSISGSAPLNPPSHCSTTPSVAANEVSAPPRKRGPGRPPKKALNLSNASVSSTSSKADDVSCKTTTKSKKRSLHLWKFMRSLLEDPVYNPCSIKWENKEEGVFRIVPGQSKVVARLWGQRKNNPSMTFDKMSRSLRWCRTYGFLSEVPKDRNYPKKLCFRFGERAADWQK